MNKRKQTLLKALRDQDKNIRTAAAEALEKLEIRGRMDALRKMIETGDKLDKMRAIYALANLKGEDALKLIAMGLNDPVEDVRSAAVRALIDMGDRRAVEPLLERLKDESPVVKRVTIEGLGFYREPKVVGPLMQMLQSKDHGVIERALEVLGRMGDKKAEEAMLYFANKGNTMMRCYALRALGTMEE